MAEQNCGAQSGDEVEAVAPITGVEVEIGLDTCASTSVCQIGFGGRDAIIITKPPAKRPMLDASGHRVKRVGTFRRVLLWLATFLLWPWTFEEMAVRRPLLSVSDLRRHGVFCTLC